MQNTGFMTGETADAVLQKARKRLLQTILSFLVVSGVALTIANAFVEGAPLQVGFIGGLVSALLLGFVTRDRFIRPTGYGLMLLLLASAPLLALTRPTGVMLGFLTMSVAMLTSAIVSSRPVYWLTVIAGVLISLGLALDDTLGRDLDSLGFLIQFSLIFIGGLVPFLIGGVTRYFVQVSQRTVANTQRAATLLEASAIIGQNMSQMLELNELLDRAVEIIRDRFAFYHVAIFLLDDGQRSALLTAATGDIGERLLARGFRLSVDSDNLIGRTAKAGEAIIARAAQVAEGSSAAVLADTRSQLGLPIADNEGAIGVLDIQSNRPDAFTATEIQALQVICNQLATAIRNARLFQEKERSIRENKRLFIEAETNLRENQRLNRQLTRESWAEYLRVDNRVEGVTMDGRDFVQAADWSPEMLDAGLRRRPITQMAGDQNTIAVPIELRGEVVGAIEVETRNPNTEEVVNMVRAISQRLAVSLDNARLFEESNEATLQEQRVSEIVSRYQTANTVDELLQITLSGLTETLGAENGSIRLGTLPELDNLTSSQVPQANGDNAE